MNSSRKHITSDHDVSPPTSDRHISPNRSHPLNDMSILKGHYVTYLVIYLFMSACSAVDQQIPVFEVGFEFDTHMLNYENAKKIRNGMILNNLQNLPESADARILGKFNTGISSRDYEILLIESRNRSQHHRGILTIENDSGHLVDHFTYNVDSLFLYLVHDETSTNGREMVFKFIHRNTLDKSVVRGIQLNVDLTGGISKGLKVESHVHSFDNLGTSGEFSGSYEHMTDSFGVSLLLKDGVTEGTHGYMLNIRTPNECLITYSSLNGEQKEGQIDLDSLGRKFIRIAEESIQMRIELDDEECGHIENQIFTLIKKSNG